MEIEKEFTIPKIISLHFQFTLKIHFYGIYNYVFKKKSVLGMKSQIQPMYVSFIAQETVIHYL